ncbi:MAG: hypothetical protein ABW184_05465 [Sphingobium sp.]
MKNLRSTSYESRRRRNPLVLPAIIVAVLFFALIGWFWSRGGEQSQQRVEKIVAPERLGR